MSIFLVLLFLLLIYACHCESGSIGGLRNAYDKYCDDNCQKYVSIYTGKPSWRISYFIGLIVASIMTMLIGVIIFLAHRDCGYGNFAIELLIIFILITLVSFTTVYKTIGWMNFHMIGGNDIDPKGVQITGIGRGDGYINFKHNELKTRNELKKLSKLKKN